MKSIMLFVCGLLVCAAGAFPLNPSFTPEAVKAYKAKADAGDAEAQYLYSSALANGRGVAEDKPQAFAYAKKAAEQGYALAQNWLGQMYEEGQGVETNLAVAAQWYRRAAEQGDARSQHMLGERHENGKGVKKDIAEAVKWYRKAAEQGYAPAQRELGWRHKVAGDVKSGQEDSLSELMDLTMVQKVAPALRTTGMMHAFGVGLAARKDMVEAVRLFRKAAVWDDAEAQCYLGWCYAKGVGITEDRDEAMKWIRSSAARGNLKAQISLGWCYANGFGVAKSAVESERWYRKAIVQNAAKVIGYLILFGLDIRMSILCVLIVVYGLLAQLILSSNSYVQNLYDWQAKKSFSSRLMWCCVLWGAPLLCLIPIGAVAALLCEIFCVTEVMPCDFGRFIEMSAFGVVGCSEPKCIFMSVVLVMFALLMLLLAIEGMSILRLVKWLRTKKLVERPNLTFAQYAKVDALGNSVLWGLGALTGICFALMGYDIQAIQVLLGTAVVILCTLPTRKKFDKILNGKPKKVALMKFIVIYREPGEPKPKQTVLESCSESSLRRECEGRGWQVLLIRRANEWSSGDLVLRAFTPIRFGVSTEELCAFCETMCTLWRAGVQVIQIIDICIREVGNAWFRERLQIVRRRMANGEDLASAMGDMRCSRAFPLRLRKRVRLGDRNGCVGNSIGRFNTAFKFERARHEVVRDMIAVAFALIECILVFGFVAMSILPFNDTVAGNGACGSVFFNLLSRFGMQKHPICMIGLFSGIASTVVILWMVIRKYATRITVRALRGKWREELYQRWRAQIGQLICRGCGEEFREEDRSCLLQLGHCPRCSAKMKMSETYDFVYRTMTRWWHLYTPASKAIPEVMGLIASLVFSVLPSIALLMCLDAFGISWGIVVLLGACSLGWFIFRRVAIGGMPLCVLCLFMSVVFLGILFIGGQHVVLISWSFLGAVGMYLFLPLLILMVPSLRRWVQTCRDERMAFAVLDRCDMKIVVLPKKERPQCADSISGFVFAVWFHGIIGLLSVCLLTHALPSCQFEGHQSRFVQHGKY